MDYPTFLAHLAETRSWQWGTLDFQFPAIRARRRNYSFCPITAVCLQVARNYHRNGDPLTAAQKLHLDPQLAVSLMNAADNWTGHDGRIRRDLLTAVGREDLA